MDLTKKNLEKQIWLQQHVTPLAGMFEQDILHQLQVVAGKCKVSRDYYVVTTK